MPLVAHAGHWIFYVLYAVPVLIVGASIVISLLRQRRDRGEGGPGAPADDASPR